MISNTDQKQMQIEERDWNYIMASYARSYLFISKNIDPEEIVFPLFETVPHPLRKGETIPVRYVPVISTEAVAIKEDGSNIPEATEEQIAALDKKDEEITELKRQVEELSGMPDIEYQPEDDVTPVDDPDLPTEEELEAEVLKDEAESLTDPTPQAEEEDNEPHWPQPNEPGSPPEEAPQEIKMPAQPATGQSDYTFQRLPTDQAHAAKDMIQEPELNEEKQKPFDKEVKRNEANEPIVEE